MIVGILGYGTLGRAIAAGLHVHDDVRSVIATTRRGLPSDGDVRVQAAPDNRALAERADVISCAAAVSTAQVRAWTGERVAVIRSMPNMPCRIREGMTVLAPGPGATP